METLTGSRSNLSKAYRRGTHRLVPPEETLARVTRWLPVMGITRIANITGLDDVGLPVVAVHRPNARSLSVSQGKGITLAAAKASGVMEAIETFHAEHIIAPLLCCSYNELRCTRPVVDIDALPKLSVSRYHPDLRISWMEGLDIVSGASAWVPHELVHLDFTLPLPQGSGSFFMSSNGLSSGNHALEAVSHGICELIERDANTLWQLASPELQHKTRLQLDSIDDVCCREIIDRLGNAGLQVAVWDTTSDVGVASFRCVIAERDPTPLRATYPIPGSGTHPCRAIALLRALTEAAQGRLTVISGSRDDLNDTVYDPKATWAKLKSLRETLGSPGVRSFHDVPNHEADDLAADVEWLLERLGRAGLHEVIVVDLTRVEFNIPVVRVIVPGLEPMLDAPGYLPGRRARARLGEESP